MSVQLEDFSLSTENKKSSGTIQKVGLVGCGSMGQEITRLISQFGIDVVFIDLTTERVEEVMQRIDEQLDDVISHWGMTPSEKKLILSRIKGSTNFEDLGDCNIIIETTNTKKPGTNLHNRKEVFRKVEEVVSEDTIITSNTATLMISDLAEVLKVPQRAAGLHFIAPVADAKFVEVVRCVRTSDKTFDMLQKFVRMIGKKPVQVNESPGNVSTRMIVPFINEACEILMEGVASVEQIDVIMREATGHHMGPFEMADRIGLDKVLKWMNNLFSEFGSLKYKPSPLLKRMVRANLNGKRTGEGFYVWDGDKKVIKQGSINTLGR